MLERFHIPLGWSELLKRTYQETLADDVFNLAAQQAYYFFFALFPALLALLSIASFFPIENLIGETTTLLQRVAPKDVTDIVTEQIVKIGQTLSTRPDLVPCDYQEALARLQDDVEPFSFADVERIVEAELRVRLSKAFGLFEAEPIAAASLGQVHQAALRDTACCSAVIYFRRARCDRCWRS